MSEDEGITRLSIGFNEIAAIIKVAPLIKVTPLCGKNFSINFHDIESKHFAEKWELAIQ